MADKDQKKLIGVIDMTPDYNVLAEDFALRLSEHGFNQFAVEPVISLIEMIRYLDRKDEDGTPLAEQSVEKILVKLRAKAARRKVA